MINVQWQNDISCKRLKGERGLRFLREILHLSLVGIRMSVSMIIARWSQMEILRLHSSCMLSPMEQTRSRMWTLLSEWENPCVARSWSMITIPEILLQLHRQYCLCEYWNPPGGELRAIWQRYGLESQRGRTERKVWVNVFSINGGNTIPLPLRTRFVGLCEFW